MARYRDSVCKLCRRERTKLFLKGRRCYTEKCAIEKRNYPPGVSRGGRRKTSDYALQLREKQKLRRMYGVLERQFRIYFHKAAKKKGITGEILLQMLECRLDNIVYRGGLALSRSSARQIIRHGHTVVNGRKVDIPSYQVKAGDEISLKSKSNDLKIIEESIEAQKERNALSWMQFDPENKTIKIIEIPKRDQMDIPIQEQVIVELYSK